MELAQWLVQRGALLLLVYMQITSGILFSKSFTLRCNKALEPSSRLLVDEEGPVVDTKSGKVRGAYSGEAQVFLSIPYAQPPVGNLRWRDPVPIREWEGTWDATHNPPICPQNVIDGTTPAHNYNEDCLYLNIFTPLNANPDSNVPVMVFIHGGAYIAGYSAMPVYDGQYIANHTNTIVVTLNYRLGVLGFLAFKGSASDEVLGGNYGVRDQRLAMQWIRDNIQGFGGDREAITLWGESAGAMSVAIHISSPLSKGLFSKAIIESDPFAYPYDTLDVAQHWGNLFARKVSCKTVACLRNMSADELIKKQLKPRWWGIIENFLQGKPKSELLIPWTPVVDNVDLFGQPLDIIAGGSAISHVPMIVGTNSHEMWLFVYLIKFKVYEFLYRDVLRVFFGKPNVDPIVNFYPPPPRIFDDARPQIANLSTDFAFICATRFAVRGAVYFKTNRAWLYDFSHAPSKSIWKLPACAHIACHGDELPFVFHNLNGSATPDEKRLSEEMVSYWTSFARYGDPNQAVLGAAASSGRSMVTWPEYTVTSIGPSGTKDSAAMRFDTPINVVLRNYESDACSLWDSIGYNF